MEGLRARLIMEKPERFGAPLTRKATPASPSPFHLYTSSLIMLHPSTHSPLHLSTCLPVHFIMSSAPELISSLFHPSTHSLLHLSNPPPSPHPPTHSFTSPTLHPLDHPSTSHPSISHPPPTHIYPYPPRHLTLPSFPRDKWTKLPLCELAEDGA